MTKEQILETYQTYYEAMHDNLSLEAASVTAAILTLTQIVSGPDQHVPTRRT